MESERVGQGGGGRARGSRAGRASQIRKRKLLQVGGVCSPDLVRSSLAQSQGGGR